MSRKRRRTCNGKRRYRDRTEAQRVLRLLAARSARSVIPTRAYQCYRCKGWHLTKEPKRT